MPDPATVLPPWAAAVLQRLDFLARQADDRAALAEATAALQGELSLPRFLSACLTLFEDAVATSPGLAAGRAELLDLSAMARQALAEGHDDRAVIRRAAPLMNQPLPIGVAAHVPGRVIWLAAMAAEVPSEESAAATMLVNDLAAVGGHLPLRALREAAC